MDRRSVLRELNAALSWSIIPYFQIDQPLDSSPTIACETFVIEVFLSQSKDSWVADLHIISILSQRLSGMQIDLRCAKDFHQLERPEIVQTQYLQSQGHDEYGASLWRAEFQFAEIGLFSFKAVSSLNWFLNTLEPYTPLPRHAEVQQN